MHHPGQRGRAKELRPSIVRLIENKHHCSQNGAL